MYYKVINRQFIEYDKVISTENEYYGKYLQETTEDQIKMFDLISDLDKELSFGVDLYHSIWNNLALFGGMYIDLIEEREENPISLSDLLQNNKHTEKIYKDQIFDIISEIKNRLVGVNFNGQWSVPEPLFNGTRFWEYLFEKIRRKEFADKISRLNAYFLFKNIDDCKYYIDLRHIDGEIVKVELVETKNIFESDMKLMDNLENHYSINKINENIYKYWNRNFTDKPLIEVLFNGTFKFL